MLETIQHEKLASAYVAHSVSVMEYTRGVQVLLYMSELSDKSRESDISQYNTSRNL
jgi:hypothetical protein